ncbi:hypothetical protein [Streptomyces spiramenti]|uniref:Uncharacterized protein n=1 Tax=Streptomyces spiramenti TaxID=2720606 RepID=A0ABX1AP80_9ACTN|nr:hypothetical protein [Streptomyces spiramenti]NJP66132.1 hypothetical protein [Streptomyces spiramenti]
MATTTFTPGPRPSVHGATALSALTAHAAGAGLDHDTAGVVPQARRGRVGGVFRTARVLAGVVTDVVLLGRTDPGDGPDTTPTTRVPTARGPAAG